MSFEGLIFIPSQLVIGINLINDVSTRRPLLNVLFEVAFVLEI